MNINDALTAIDAATAAARDAARAVAASGKQAGVQPAQALIQNLLTLEQGSANLIAQAVGRPLPAPAPEKVGLWTQEARQALVDVLGAAVSDGIGGAAQKLANDAASLREWATAAPQQVPAGPTAGVSRLASVSSTAGATQTPASTKSQKVVGGALVGASLLGAGLAAFLAWRHEQKIAKNGNPLDPRVLPRAADQAQAILDSELPGARLQMTRSPDDEWVASVHKGGNIIAREIQKSPDAAAARATKKAIASSAPAGSPWEIEDAVLVPERKTKRVGKSKEA